jgi:hypothetical protein
MPGRTLLSGVSRVSIADPYRRRGSFIRLRRAAGADRPRARLVSSGRSSSGQAAVELVALLPVAAALLAGLWQLTLVGHAAWGAATAARAAARAHAVGHDPRQAARDHLPGSLEHGLEVDTPAAGDVEVHVRIPTIPGLPNLGHTTATAHFEPQS